MSLHGNRYHFDNEGKYFSICPIPGIDGWWVDKYQEAARIRWTAYACAKIHGDDIVWTDHFFLSQEDLKIAEKIILRLHKIRLFL